MSGVLFSQEQLERAESRLLRFCETVSRRPSLLSGNVSVPQAGSAAQEQRECTPRHVSDRQGNRCENEKYESEWPHEAFATEERDMTEPRTPSSENTLPAENPIQPLNRRSSAECQSSHLEEYSRPHHVFFTSPIRDAAEATSSFQEHELTAGDAVETPSKPLVDQPSSRVTAARLNSPAQVTDFFPLETARARFLRLFLEHFVTHRTVAISEEAQLAALQQSPGQRKRKMDAETSAEIQVRPLYEGDPRLLLPVTFLANAYESLVSDVDARMDCLEAVKGKSLGLSLEASGGLYRKLMERFPPKGAVTIYRRREMASATEAKARFPELLAGRDEKRVRFMVVHGLEMEERPGTMAPEDAEWWGEGGV